MAHDPSKPVKRLKYFTGQFLEAADFTAEQDYHLDMRLRGNRALYYSAGILDDGFRVTSVEGDSKIEISPGVGVNTHGQELVIVTPIRASLPFVDTTSRVFFVTLKYDDQPTDEQTAGDRDISDTTRIEEIPIVEPIAEGIKIDKDSIVIAKVTLDDHGLATKIDGTVRQYANARFPGKLGIGKIDTTKNLNVGLEINKGDTNDLALLLSSSGPGWGSGIQFQNSATPHGRTYGIYADPGLGSLHISDEATRTDRLVIDKTGNVGIGTAIPTNMLHVQGATGIRQNRLYLGGDRSWSSLSYNAHHNAANNGWTFPDPSRSAVTIEMDDDDQGRSRFEVWTTTSLNKTGWLQRFRIDGETGNVGIGTADPRAKLEIVGDSDNGPEGRNGCYINANDNGHGAIINTPGSGKAVAILTNSNIAYTNGRIMKKVIGGGEFKGLSYQGILDINYRGPYLSTNSIGAVLNKAGVVQFYTNFNLPLNAVIDSVRILVSHTGSNTGDVNCKLALQKMLQTASGWTAVPVLTEDRAGGVTLTLATGQAIEKFNLPVIAAVPNRTVNSNDENFAIEILAESRGHPNAGFALLWVEINYTLYDILSW